MIKTVHFKQKTLSLFKKKETICKKTADTMYVQLVCKKT